MGGNQGPEWDFVEELTRGKHTSHVRCKLCVHEFHGSTTRIKEHLFKAGVNVVGCANPPPNLASKLYKWASKLKSKTIALKSGTTSNVPVFEEQRMEPSIGSLNDEHTIEGCVNVDNVDHIVIDSYPMAKDSSTRHSSKTHDPLASAFDRSASLELHLKWTQAFVACGISFNVMHNPIFQDALICTSCVGSKITIPPYNKMHIEYLDKVKHSLEQNILQIVLGFVPIFMCTIAIDGWTSCKKKTTY